MLAFALATPLLLPRGLCRSDFRLDELAQLLVLALDRVRQMAVLQQLLGRLHQPIQRQQIAQSRDSHAAMGLPGNINVDPQTLLNALLDRRLLPPA